jgi:hypothetical protein
MNLQDLRLLGMSALFSFVASLLVFLGSWAAGHFCSQVFATVIASILALLISVAVFLLISAPRTITLPESSGVGIEFVDHEIDGYDIHPISIFINFLAMIPAILLGFYVASLHLF